jgi:hypothetical protein
MKHFELKWYAIMIVGRLAEFFGIIQKPIVGFYPGIDPADY